MPHIVAPNWHRRAHPSSPMPRWIAHRGGGTQAPENTLAGFELAYALGFRAFECDVQRTRDGVCVLMHDDDLLRTTGTSACLLQCDWADVRCLDAAFGWPDHSPATAIPSLIAVLDWARDLDVCLNLELKPVPGDASANAQACAATLSACGWAHEDDRLLISSFSPAALAEFSKHHAGLARALLCETLSDEALNCAQALGVQGLSSEHRQWRADWVTRAHAQGWACAAYTVNEAADVERLLALGIDSWFTDAVRTFGPQAQVRATGS